MARPKVGDERREQILAAFEACVVRKGLAEVTLADVAEEAAQPRSLVRYFIGNRDEMVTCLIDRLLLRGDAQLSAVLGAGSVVSAAEVAPLLFDRIFADHVTNVVMMELWHLSIRDEALRERLAAIYRRLVVEVSDKLALDGSAADSAPAFDAAFTAISLAFGTAFFAHLGLVPNDFGRIRTNVNSIVRDYRSPRSTSPAEEAS